MSKLKRSLFFENESLRAYAILIVMRATYKKPLRAELNIFRGSKTNVNLILSE